MGLTLQRKQSERLKLAKELTELSLIYLLKALAILKKGGILQA